VNGRAATKRLTPLMLAIGCAGSLETVRVLVKGAGGRDGALDLSVADADGRTALRLARERGLIEIVAYLDAAAAAAACGGGGEGVCGGDGAAAGWGPVTGAGVVSEEAT
jgi:hypothetical protein